MFITPRLSVLGFGSLTSIHFADQAIRSCSWRYFFAHGKTRSAVIVVLFSATPVCYKVLNLGDVMWQRLARHFVKQPLCMHINSYFQCPGIILKLPLHSVCLIFCKTAIIPGLNDAWQIFIARQHAYMHSAILFYQFVCPPKERWYVSKWINILSNSTVW